MLTSETKTRMTLTGRLSAERGNRKALRKGCDSSQAWGEYTPNVERVEAECNVVVRQASGRAPGGLPVGSRAGFRGAPGGMADRPVRCPRTPLHGLFRRETTFRRRRAATARPLAGEYAGRTRAERLPSRRRTPARGVRRSIRIRFERRAPARRQVAEAHQHPVGEPPDHTSLEGDGRAGARRAGA